jgi:uncharacterized membrane protein YeaQ/YmgE (transglycosylase-associated protein family)
MNDRLQPAFWGGLFIGVLSALPIVNAGNCCCCLWVLLGGGLAAYLRQQNTPYQITAGEGALVGLFAGLIGAVIGTVLAIPFHMMTSAFGQNALERAISSNPDIPPELRDAIERFVTSPARWVFALMVSLVVDAVFGALGGLLGVTLFKKNLPPPPPPGTIDVPPTPYVPPSPMPPPLVEPPPPPPSV